MFGSDWLSRKDNGNTTGGCKCGPIFILMTNMNMETPLGGLGPPSLFFFELISWCCKLCATSAGTTNKLETTLGNTVHFHEPFITFKLTFTGFLCLLSLWQQHDTAPVLYASTACPNGRTDYHTCFLSPPCSLQHPINRNLHFVLSFIALATTQHVTHHPHIHNVTQWLERLPHRLLTTSPLTLPTWKA